MTNKTTKRALFSSLMALVLCFAMLLGTTFAWFTDSVTVDGNVIKSGTLDVNMEWANGKEDPNAATWVDATEGPIFNNDLWEPGYTEARHIKVTNDGTLALNWKLAVVANGTVSMLADVIDVYYYDGYGYGSAIKVVDRDVSDLEYVGTLTEWLSSDIVSGTLQAGKDYSMTIVLKMREEAGNEYQNLSIGTDFSVKLIATQLAYESDSFDKNYDEFAGKTVVNPETAQAAIWAAEEGDIIHLTKGTYGNLVVENEDGSPKKGITIESKAAGTNPTSPESAFSVASINLNSSENVTIRNIYFDMAKAELVYSKSGATNYYACVVGAKAGAATGANGIVIEGCAFGSNNAYDVNTHVAIYFEEQGRPTSRATDITVRDCDVENKVFNFVRMNYMSEGTITIQGNNLPEGTAHSALNFTGNSADLMIRDNVFGSSIMNRINKDGWNPEKAMLGTSRQGTHTIKVEITGNTFYMNKTLVEGEGHVVELKSSYTTENCEFIFENNTFGGSLKGMTEETVPCVWH